MFEKNADTLTYDDGCILSILDFLNIIIFHCIILDTNDNNVSEYKQLCVGGYVYNPFPRA